MCFHQVFGDLLLVLLLLCFWCLPSFLFLPRLVYFCRFGCFAALAVFSGFVASVAVWSTVLLVAVQSTVSCTAAQLAHTHISYINGLCECVCHDSFVVLMCWWDKTLK